MPTPSSNEDIVAASLHSSCPPDDDRSSWRSVEMDESHADATHTTPEIFQQPTPPRSDSQAPGSTDSHIVEQQGNKRMDIDEESHIPDMLSPMSAEGDKHDDTELHALSNTDISSPSMGYDFSNIRVCTYLGGSITLNSLIWQLIPSSPSSFLRAGSRFHGTQQSERQVYDVQVEIKHVDMRESFLCGYLRIQGGYSTFYSYIKVFTDSI
jgi:hypothetical protein